MNFPEQLKKLRLEYDMTQKELADKINSSPSKVGMWEAGVQIKTVQKLLGHADIKTTMNIYTHVMSDVKEDAVKKLNDFL